MALIPFKSPLIADVGVSMGDEGKGRLIPELVAELSQEAGRDAPVGLVFKVNGGANSGHTAGGLKLNLIPAGVVSPSVPHLGLGSGVVADPRKLFWELTYIALRGYEGTLERLVIDERTLVSDVTHRLLDLACEHYRSHVLGEEPRGSTGRGITPAYLDEVGQFQIYYADFLAGKDRFARRLTTRATRACRMIQHIFLLPPENWDGLFATLTQAETRANAETLEAGALDPLEVDFGRFNAGRPFALDTDALVEAYWEAGQRLAGQIHDLREVVREHLDGGRSIIGEFGQSFWLDKRAGFPPNVTASHTYTPELFQSAGIPAQTVHTIGCCKAYDTKVGTHVFLTRMDDEHPLAGRLKHLEFGTSTGRQRMVGWFDAVEKGDTLRYGGFDDLVLNKLDALTYGGDWREGALRICTAYQTPAGERLLSVPRNEAVRSGLKPVYAELPGWAEDIATVRAWGGLPENARRYIAACLKATIDCATRGQAHTSAPGHLPNLRYVGVGPEPSQIIRDIPATTELLALAELALSSVAAR